MVSYTRRWMVMGGLAVAAAAAVASGPTLAQQAPPAPAPTAAKALTAAGAIVHLSGRPGENEAAWPQAGPCIAGDMGSQGGDGARPPPLTP